MPAHQPAQDHYSAATIAKCVKARQSFEDPSGRKLKGLSEQQKKDYAAVCKVIHRDSTGKHPTSQELQNIYRRVGV